ncbi:hypothetical protein [Aliiglaciecola sp. NS0011-25]|uniref:hypothetical protein n=1 Tax=Aliiglaciecola sp. NS0011-25 TaxID=3127654 RepID=UPI003106B52E
MNKLKVVASIIILIAAFVLILHDVVVVGLHAFLGAFLFFLYAMITFEDPPKIREVKPVPYISPAMFYENLRLEKRRQCLENVALRKYKRDKAKRRNGYSGMKSLPDIVTAVSSSISFTDDDLAVNPATGEVMIGGIGGVDTSGNPYGSDSHDSDRAMPIDDTGIDTFSDDSFSSFDDNAWSDTSISTFDDDW